MRICWQVSQRCLLEWLDIAAVLIELILPFKDGNAVIRSCRANIVKVTYRSLPPN